MGDLMVRPQNGAAMVTQGFGEQSVTPHAETAAQAVAAREKAAVEARYIMAMRMPRSIEAFRVAILDECRCPGFAAVLRSTGNLSGKSATRTATGSRSTSRGRAFGLSRRPSARSET